MHWKKYIPLAITALILLSSCGQKYTTEQDGNITYVYNKNGQPLGYSASSGIGIIEDKGFAFKVT